MHDSSFEGHWVLDIDLVLPLKRYLLIEDELQVVVGIVTHYEIPLLFKYRSQKVIFEVVGIGYTLDHRVNVTSISQIEASYSFQLWQQRHLSLYYLAFLLRAFLTGRHFFKEELFPIFDLTVLLYQSVKDVTLKQHILHPKLS